MHQQETTPESEDGIGEPSEQWREYQGAPTGTEIECEGGAKRRLGVSQ